MDGKFVMALWDYEAQDTNELSMREGSVVELLAQHNADWWEGRLDGHIGLFPANRVRQLTSEERTYVVQQQTVEADGENPFESSQEHLASPRPRLMPKPSTFQRSNVSSIVGSIPNNTNNITSANSGSPRLTPNNQLPNPSVSTPPSQHNVKSYPNQTPLQQFPNQPPAQQYPSTQSNIQQFANQPPSIIQQFQNKPSMQQFAIQPIIQQNCNQSHVNQPHTQQLPSVTSSPQRLNQPPIHQQPASQQYQNHVPVQPYSIQPAVQQDPNQPPQQQRSNYVPNPVPQSQLPQFNQPVTQQFSPPSFSQTTMQTMSNPANQRSSGIESPTPPPKPVRSNAPAPAVSATLRNAGELAKKLAIMGTHAGSAPSPSNSSSDLSRTNSDDDIVEEQDSSVPLFTSVRKRALLSYKSEKAQGKWKNVYVELLPKTLILYKYQGRRKPERKDREIVLIKFDLKKTKLDMNPGQSEKKKYCVGLSDASRNIVLQFSSESEISEWLGAFRDDDKPMDAFLTLQVQRKPKEESSEKQTIRAKLLNFFKSRPTVEKLKEKGFIPQDLVFGGYLDLQCRKESRQVPLMLQVWTERIEKHDESINLDDDEWADINLISGILKLYFRELQIPLFTFAKYDSFLNAVKIDDYNEKMYALRDVLYSLPPTHFHTLKHLLYHLRKVASHANVNKMEPSNLAIVFGPTLLRPEEESIHTVMNMGFQNGVVELLIEQCEWFFSK